MDLDEAQHIQGVIPVGVMNVQGKSAVGEAQNVHFGVNHGNVYQHTYHTTVLPGRRETIDLLAALKPVLHASHTRNRDTFPPNSKCFPETRQRVIDMILSWATGPLGGLPPTQSPHIMWVYGFLGCGKSAIAQEVAELLSLRQRLAASFFFWRGSDDRNGVANLATTIAAQILASFPSTVGTIGTSIQWSPGLALASKTSLKFQFLELVLKPIMTIFSSSSPATIVLDGIDECEDHGEIVTLIEDIMRWLDANPGIPLRFLITSRMEDHIFQALHSSVHVRVFNLVSYTSSADICAALDVAIAKGRRSRLCEASWPSADDKAKLVRLIGDSFLLMDIVVKELFKPSNQDDLTPMDRLPHILESGPNFSNLFKGFLEETKRLPYFLAIISVIVLAPQSLSVTHIADILSIKIFDVTRVLVNLHAIVDVPDDHSPITLFHISFRDFLCSKDQAGPEFFADRWGLIEECVRLAARYPNSLSQTSKRSRSFVMEQWGQQISPFAGQHELVNQELAKLITAIRTCFPNLRREALDLYFCEPVDRGGRTALEFVTQAANWEGLKLLLDQNIGLGFGFRGGGIALEAAFSSKNWASVEGLVHAGADVNAPFLGHLNSRDGVLLPLHAACFYGNADIVSLLLEKGANPNLCASDSTDFRSWGYHSFPLAFACYRGDIKLATRLLACKADPNLRGGSYGTALRAASRNGSLDAVILLLKHGADPNATGVDPESTLKSGATPLHEACFDGHVKVIECLLKHNADPMLKNDVGETVLQYARKWNEAESDVVRVLKQFEQGVKQRHRNS